MSVGTKIEWTDATWNPVTGCTKVSPGCDNCYAEKIVDRFHGKGAFGDVRTDPAKLDFASKTSAAGTGSVPTARCSSRC
jgi:protein gp37